MIKEINEKNIDYCTGGFYHIGYIKASAKDLANILNIKYNSITVREPNITNYYWYLMVCKDKNMEPIVFSICDCSHWYCRNISEDEIIDFYILVKNKEHKVEVLNELLDLNLQVFHEYTWTTANSMLMD